MRGLTHASWQACNRGISRYILADLWRLRQRGHCRRLSSTGDRFSWRRARLRPHRGDDGLCGRTYFRRALQPGDHDRSMGREADSVAIGLTLTLILLL